MYFILWIILVRYATSVQDTLVKIYPEQKEFLCPIGGSIVFDCVLKISQNNLHEVPFPYINWFTKEDIVITSHYKDKFVSIEETVIKNDSASFIYSKILFISNIKNEHAGIYFCNMTKNSDIYAMTKLLIFRDIEFKKTSNEIYVIPNSLAFLPCEAAGEPKPNITWKFLGKKLKTDKLITIQKDGLLLKNVTFINSGEYHCLAEVRDEGRFNIKSLVLKIARIPELNNNFSTSIQVRPGSSISINCSCDGEPSPTYKFRQINGTINERWKLNSTLGIIYLYNANLSDSGWYECVAHNMVGFLNTTFYIEVTSTPKIIQFENVSEFKDMSATFTCYSDTEVNVSFLISTKSFTLGHFDRYIVSKLNNQTYYFVINDLRPSDAGEVSCIAQNENGIDSRSARLQILYGPIFTCDSNKTKDLYLTSSIKLTCCACSNPPPFILWIYNYSQIIHAHNSTLHCSESSIEVTLLESKFEYKYGIYECLVFNIHGNISLKYLLSKDGSSNFRHFTLSLKKASSTWAVLSLDPPLQDNGQVINIQYDNITLEFKFDQVILLKYLKPYTNYVIEARLMMNLSSSSPIISSFTTKYIGVPCVPKIISDHISTHTSKYVVEWTLDDDGGSEILHFILILRSFSLAYNFTIQVIYIPENICIPNSVFPCKYKYTFKDLIIDHEYILDVKSANKFGVNFQSPFVFKTLKNNWNNGQDMEVIYNSRALTFIENLRYNLIIYHILYYMYTNY